MDLVELLLVAAAIYRDDAFLSLRAYDSEHTSSITTASSRKGISLFSQIDPPTYYFSKRFAMGNTPTYSTVWIHKTTLKKQLYKANAALQL